MRIIGAQRVTKVTARNVQHDLVPWLDLALANQCQVTVKLVQHLKNDASEIHRVGSRQRYAQVLQALVEAWR